jgi:transcriptional regulator with XRE-family HTH domain
MTIGTRLVQMRNAKNISQAELARRLQISPPALANYEKDNRDPPARILIRLCTEFKVNPAWLLMGQGNMTEQDNDALFAQAVRVAWAHLDSVHGDVQCDHLLKLSGALFRYLKEHGSISQDMADNFFGMVV